MTTPPPLNSQGKRGPIAASGRLSFTQPSESHQRRPFHRRTGRRRPHAADKGRQTEDERGRSGGGETELFGPMRWREGQVETASVVGIGATRPCVVLVSPPILAARHGSLIPAFPDSQCTSGGCGLGEVWLYEYWRSPASTPAPAPAPRAEAAAAAAAGEGSLHPSFALSAIGRWGGHPTGPLEFQQRGLVPLIARLPSRGRGLG